MSVRALVHGWVIIVSVLAIACGGSDDERTGSPTAATTQLPDTPRTTSSPVAIESQTRSTSVTTTAPAGSPVISASPEAAITILLEPRTARTGNRFTYWFHGLTPRATYVLSVLPPWGDNHPVRVTPDESGIILVAAEDERALGIRQGDPFYSYATRATVPSGRYTIRLYADDGVTLLATDTFTTTAPPAGSPTTASRIPVAEEAMEAILHLEQAGDLEAHWALLHPGQQAIVSQEALVRCQQGQSLRFTDLEILDSFNEESDVATVGQIDTVAVVVRLTFLEGEDTTIFHVAEVNDVWRWFFRALVVEQYATGQCPSL